MYYSQHMAYVLYPGSVPAYLCTTVNTWLMFSIQAQCLLIYVLQSTHGLCSLSRLSACLFMYYSQHMAYVLYPGSVPAYLCTTVNTWLMYAMLAQCLLIYVLQATLLLTAPTYIALKYLDVRESGLEEVLNNSLWFPSRFSIAAHAHRL